ncbi:MAG: cation:proton antiporter [Bacteroidales bacterium]|nr:cation:proton antiporter [Bacteroidales bacterium]
MDIQTEWVLLGLGILAIFSYLFDLLAHKTKFPSVILLVLIGILVRIYADAKGFTFPVLEDILPTLGSIGLILIVLEGAMELSTEREKLGLIIRAFFSSLVIMLITVTALTSLFYYGFQMELYISIVNAIPLSIISSAVAIPSSMGFTRNKREFIIYESSFSDILGIILFNHTLANRTFEPSIFLDFGFEIVIVLVVTMICSFLLIKLLRRIEHKIKYFLPIAVLIILYALGKMFHISALMMVFFFGLFMANSRTLFPRPIRKYLDHEQVDINLKQLQLLTGESAFLIRTFFFLVFGFTIVVSKMGNPWLFLWGTIIIVIIFLIRFAYLRLTSRGKITPEVFIAPRGLINILLFLSIPTALLSDVINQYVLLIVFIFSLLVMIWGGISWKKPRSGRELMEEVGEISSTL